MDVEQNFSTSEGSKKSPKEFGFLIVPEHLVCSTAHPFYFGPWSKIVFGSGCALIVANLYYCQPLLIQMSIDFKTTYADVSQIPTFGQVGYCVGLFLISPLGDLLPRRQLILALVFVTTCLSVGLALSKNLLVFQTLTFLLGVFNVTPQILVPFAADLASPGDRAAVVSVMQSGIMLGILFARVLAGVVAYFSQWRMVYYVSIGIQTLVLCGTYLFVPDQPRKNLDIAYLDMFYSMMKYLVTEPRLIQAVLINVASVACWSSFWVTLTFLLGGSPYYFSTLYNGLFGLFGIVGVLVVSLLRHFSDRFGTWQSLLIATCCLLVLQSIETAASGTSIFIVVMFCVGLGVFRQLQTVSLQTIVFGISDNARSRLNAVLTLSLSAGQAMGTSTGTLVFLRYGWRAASALPMAFYGWQLFVICLRGPNCERYTWFGYGDRFGRYEAEQTQKTVKSAIRVSSAAVGDARCTNLDGVEHRDNEGP